MRRTRARRLPLVSLLAAAAVAATSVAACTDTTLSPSSTDLTSPATVTTIPTPSTLSPSAVPAPPKGTKWKLVFADEFSGAKLETNRWATCYPWAEDICTNVNSSEDQLYTPRNVTVASGQLQLTARREQITDAKLGTYPFTSGMVSTQRPDRTLFAFRYGFVQARIWIPGGSGLWSALWLLDAHGAEQPEIDIAENLGQKPDLVDQFVHWLDRAGGRQQFGNELSVPGMYEGWHTYAVDWEPQALSFYVDGMRVWVMDYAPAIPQQDMIVIANLAVGGHYAKTPPASTRFPSTLRFDWIRIWQHS